MESQRNLIDRMSELVLGPGDQLFSEGKTSQVYQKVLNTETYAVKLIKPHEPSYFDYLYNQINILSNLSHPNILKIVNFNYIEKFIISQFFKNGTLHALANDSTVPLRPEIIKKLFQSCVLGVDYLHSRRIVHRDLKLINIFLDDQWNPIIGDFGFACEQQGRKTSVDQLLGTQTYLSPESYKKQNIDLFASDIFALGVLFFELLFGFEPFDSEKFLKSDKKCAYFLISQGKHDEYFKKVEQHLDFEIEGSVQTLLMGMLDPDPSLRFSTKNILEHEYFQNISINQDNLIKILDKHFTKQSKF